MTLTPTSLAAQLGRELLDLGLKTYSLGCYHDGERFHAYAAGMGDSRSHRVTSGSVRGCAWALLKAAAGVREVVA